MAEFWLGDKVRCKYNKNLIGTVITVNINTWNTEKVTAINVSFDDGNIFNDCAADNWELYFEVGDIVVHKSSGKTYQIDSVYPGDDNMYNLERFDSFGTRYMRIYIPSDDIRLAENDEILEFNRLKELHEAKEKETEEMTSYKVGDIVNHPLYNESIIIDISRFESGHIEIVPLTGLNRGLPVLVSIDNLNEQSNNKFIMSIEDYNKMANTIENLRKEKVDLQEKLCAAYDKARLAEAACRLRLNSFYGISIYGNNNLPEIKEVLYHKPATIIFWKDGTKTVVKTQKKEKYDKEKGFVMACLKKILGNKGNYYEVIKKWTEEDK